MTKKYKSPAARTHTAGLFIQCSILFFFFVCLVLSLEQGGELLARFGDDDVLVLLRELGPFALVHEPAERRAVEPAGEDRGVLQHRRLPSAVP